MLAEEQANKLAKLDGLTKIPNRRTLDEFIQLEWRRCKRLNKAIGMLIMDIDYFKLLNDNYGHQVGDECLKMVAKLLKGFAKRPSDICARYGGEEFALVWGDINLDESLNIAEHLMKNISNLKIPNYNSPIAPFLTVSMGLAIITPTKDNDISSLISHADQMLYRAKQNGRNRLEY